MADFIRPSYMPTLLNCQGSLQASYGRTDKGGQAANRGTVLHDIAYKCYTNDNKPERYVGKVIAGHEVTDEDADHVRRVLEYVREIAGEAHAEVKLTFGRWVPEGASKTGTADLIIINDDVLYVIDYKFGRNEVKAERNEQLLYYALGAWDKYNLDYDFTKIVFVILQPMAGNYDEWYVDIDAVLKWGMDAKDYLSHAMKTDNPTYTPGAKQCRFCKARHDCKALYEYTVGKMPKGNPDALEQKEVAEALDAIPTIKIFIDAIEKRAVDDLTAGKEIPGYKVVEGKSQRRMKPSAELALVEELGDDAYINEPKLLGIGQAEKALGKKHPFFKEHVFKPEGKPTVVKEDDKRPAINNAGKFKNLESE